MWCIFYYIFEIRIGRNEKNMKRCHCLLNRFVNHYPISSGRINTNSSLRKKNQQDKAEHRLGLLGKQK